MIKYRSNTRHQAHDKLFRFVMSKTRFARTFVEKALPPQLIDDLDLATLQQLDSQLGSLQVDYVCKVKRQSIDEFILVLIEHQSYPDPMMAWRMRCYVHELMRKHVKKNKRLPVVIPLVFYTGQQEYNVPLDLRSILGGNAEMKELGLALDYLLIQGEMLCGEAKSEDPIHEIIKATLQAFELVQQDDEEKWLPLMRQLAKMRGNDPLEVV